MKIIMKRLQQIKKLFVYLLYLHSVNFHSFLPNCPFKFNVTLLTFLFRMPYVALLQQNEILQKVQKYKKKMLGRELL